ncbi:MAG TPA: thiolase family protein [Candidatus Nitrosopolaris sp.]|nr:thiolase family protein [Candidatus Nitrosopolaris sp.]
MREVVVVDAVRTPVGKGHPEKGIFKDVRADDLGVVCVRALLARRRFDPATIEDLIFGCANQQGEQGFNIARMIGLLAGLPIEVAGTTVDRQCGSSLQAVNFAAYSIATGNADVVIAGGVEHMGHIPMGKGADPNRKLFDRFPPAMMFMGQTAEILAERKGISREDSDRFALRSNQRAVAAHEEGRFKDEMVPVALPGGGTADRDQGPRADTTLEKLAALAPSFKEGGQVTAGNSSQISDGAAAVLLMTRERAKELGLPVLATIRATAVAGVDPEIMGWGPVPASQKALKRAGLRIDQMDLVEINEAFACQVLACARELKIPEEKLNVNGGAVALGHPLGCSGARLTAALLHELRRRQGRFGLATMCIGFGQGIATVFERE